jgi:alpha-galactosidase
LRRGTRVRYEVMRHLGFFVTESSEHFAEYVPWFIKSGRPDLFGVPLDEYPRRCERQIARWDALRERVESDGPAALADVDEQPSVEFGARIVRACETGEPFAFHGNVPNCHDGGRLIDASRTTAASRWAALPRPPGSAPSPRAPCRGTSRR